MSALPPEADMLIVGINVCYVRDFGVFPCPVLEIAERVHVIPPRLAGGLAWPRSTGTG